MEHPKYELERLVESENLEKCAKLWYRACIIALINQATRKDKNTLEIDAKSFTAILRVFEALFEITP